MLKPLLPIPFGGFPIYWVMMALAFGAGLLVFFQALKTARFSPDMRRRVRRSFFWGTIFGLAGAVVVNWFLYEDLLSRSLYHRLTDSPYSIFFGLIFFFTAAAVFLRLQRVRVGYCLNLIVPAVLMTQFIARLGCSLTGCCWGKEVTLFNVTFPLPVRELEAIFALVLFFVLRRRWFAKRFNIYILAYSLFRFATEFLRGDNRGSLFGITAVSPTAMVAAVIALIAGIALIIRPLLRACGKEEWLDRFKAAFVPKPQPGRVPYTPDAFNYAGPTKSHPMKWVVSSMAMLTAAAIVFIYLNPLSLAWCDDARYALDDTFGFIFEEGSVKTVIGETNGETLTDLSGEGVIQGLEAARTVALKKDSFAKLQLSEGSVEKLPGGNHLYTFSQLIDGLPVLGNNRIVVTDRDHNALYMAGDAAEFSYTNLKVAKIPTGGKTLQDIFGAKLSIGSSTKGWYDSGEGLVPATHVVINDQSGQPALGATLQDADNTILTITPADSQAPSTDENSAVLLGAENVLNNEQPPADDEPENPLTEDRVEFEEALREAEEETEVSPEEYDDALRSALIIARRLPGTNRRHFGELLGAELESKLKNSGADPDRAAECRAEVAEVFEDEGLEPTDDEPATAIVAQPRQSSFRYKMNSNADKDVFTLAGQPNHTTELTVSTAAPVTVQVCDDDGRAILEMYVNERETIALYPEDGTDFVVKVSGQGSAVSPISGASYGISARAVSEEDRIPAELTGLLHRIEDYYDRSNLTAFIATCAMKDGAAFGEEALLAGAAAAATDSCAGCVGMETGVDSAKSAMAMVLIPAESIAEEMTFLEGSTISLDYFHHIETEQGMYVKARLAVEQDGVELYRGFTFLELTSGAYLESAELPETGDEEVDQLIGTVMDTATDLSYYITDVNSDAMLTAFGDTRGNISETREVDSLYDLWESYEEKNGTQGLWLKCFDEQEALKYHSAEKVQAFKAFTVRYNLMMAEQQRAFLLMQQATYDCIYGIGEPAKDIYDLVSNPWMFALDKTVGANEYTETGWKLIKGAIDLDGAVTDEVFGIIFDTAKAESDALDPQIAVYDALIAMLKKTYESYK